MASMRPAAMIPLLLLLMYCHMLCIQSSYFDRSSPLVKAFAARVFKEGVELEATTNIDNALGYYQNAFEIAPSAAVAYHLASVFENQNFHAESSMFWLLRASELDPSNVTTLNKIGLIYHYSTNYATAIHYFSRAIEQFHSFGLDTNADIHLQFGLATTAAEAVALAAKRELMSEVWFNIGVSYAHSGSIELAGEAYYRASVLSNPTGSTYYFPVMDLSTIINVHDDAMYIDEDDINRVMATAARHVIITPNFRSLLNLAALHHGYGMLSDGVAAYREALSQMNQYSDSLQLYRTKLATLDEMRRRKTQTETVDGSTSIDARLQGIYEVNWNMFTMTRSNLGAALIQNDQIQEAEKELLKVQAYVRDINKYTCVEFPSNTLPPDQDSLRLAECIHIAKSLSHISSLILNARKRYCNWFHWEVGWMGLLADSQRALKNERIHHAQAQTIMETKASAADRSLPTLTPFDSLLLPYITAEERLQLAVATSETITANVIAPHQHENKYSQLKLSLQQQDHLELPVSPPKIKIGFLSYDFNSHPTAHLVEAIFVEISKCKVKGASIAKAECLLNTVASLGSDHKPNDINATDSSSDRVNFGRRVFADVVLYIYSYGKDDNSTYRRSLQKLAYKFTDLSTINFVDSASLIHADGIDILLEMQLHTLGHRLQITAHHPAPIQVSYLVYPGTAGASSFLSHVVADSTVVPVDSHGSGREYSEKMLLLPETYQVSFDGNAAAAVESSTTAVANATTDCGAGISGQKLTVSAFDKIATDRLALRERFGLPMHQDTVVIMNFNKIDKLDPISFQVWMQMLQRKPRSILWLLSPEDKKTRIYYTQRDLSMEQQQQQQQQQQKNEDIIDHGRGRDRGQKRQPTDVFVREEELEPQQNLLTKEAIFKMARMYGVSSSRIIFGERTDKASHIKRHVAADLFIDTFTYGAHSTATDALRGGLPVMTVEGAFFPSRVGASLYTSLLDSSGHTDSASINKDMQQLKDLMVLPSLKEVEDLSIRLLRRGKDRCRGKCGAESVDTWSGVSVGAPLSQMLIGKLIAATTPDSIKTEANNSISTTGTLGSPIQSSCNSVPIGFFDSAAAVSKLVYGLEALFESEAFVNPSRKFLSDISATTNWSGPGAAESERRVDSRATHGHVVLCRP